MNLVLQNFVAGNKRNYLCILIKSFNSGKNEFRVRNFDNKNINESVVSSKPIKWIYIRCRHRFYFSCWTFGFVILIIKEDGTLPPLLHTKMVLKKHKIGESRKNFQFKM